MLNCVDLGKSDRELGPDSGMTLISGTTLPKSYIRFGPFELRTDTRELRKQGTRIKLQSKPAQILEILAARPGELVRRDELCERLWPGGIFVDVESGVNTAMNRLRTALGDVAEKPRYIETIPRLGYRFICPVQDASVHRPDSAGGDDEAIGAPIHLPSTGFPENMFLRLALAMLLALACQFVVFYLDLPAAVARACLIK